MSLQLHHAREALAAMGHDLNWRLAGPVCSNRPGDPGWEALLDGEVVARGGSLGQLAMGLATALMQRGIDVRPWCATNSV